MKNYVSSLETSDGESKANFDFLRAQQMLGRTLDIAPSEKTHEQGPILGILVKI